MLGYVCKYAPVEIFEYMGAEMCRIEPEVTNFSQADMRMHPNVCSFAKGVLEDVLEKDYEGVILTTCCDSEYTGALKAPVRCFGNHLSGKGKSSFQTDNECGGAAILKK